MSTGPRYTVITYIMGDYEQVHEITERSERADYLLITDNQALKSETWKIIGDPSLTGGPFNKVMSVRWNPWKYTAADIVITVDGSLGINCNLDELVDAFNAGNHELGIVIHSHRNTAVAELEVWSSFRNHERAVWQRDFLKTIRGYDIYNYRGLYQTGFMIRRQTERLSYWETLVKRYLLAIGGDEYDRLDQVLASYALNQFCNDLRCLWFSERLLESKFITWYGHGTNDVVHQTDLIEPYAFNRPVEVYI